MRILSTVELDGLQTPMIEALPVINAAFARQGMECVITCGLNGVHKKGSLHAKGLALDFRTRSLPASIQNKIKTELNSQLGDYYDVVLEKDHLHIEYDRKVKT